MRQVCTSPILPSFDAFPIPSYRPGRVFYFGLFRRLPRLALTATDAGALINALAQNL